MRLNRNFSSIGDANLGQILFSFSRLTMHPLDTRNILAGYIDYRLANLIAIKTGDRAAKPPPSMASQ